MESGKTRWALPHTKHGARYKGNNCVKTHMGPVSTAVSLIWGYLGKDTNLYCWCCLVAQSCPTLSNPRDCSPPHSSIHGILQARTLEWVTISSSKGSSWPRDGTHVSYVFCIDRRILYHWASLEALLTCTPVSSLPSPPEHSLHRGRSSPHSQSRLQGWTGPGTQQALSACSTNKEL